MLKNADVVVIGGGIIGLTTAVYLSKAGLRVAVYDRSDFGTEASWAGAGILPPGNPDRAATAVDRLRAIGAIRFPELTSELHTLTGLQNGYRRCGAIEFLTPADEYVLPLWTAEGIAFERLNRQSLARLEPGLATERREAYFLPDCAQVRNPWHLRALVAACRQLGVQLHPNTGIQQLVSSANRVVGLTLTNGEQVAADFVLIAGGAWSAGLLTCLGQPVPVFPVRGQIVLLKHPEPVLRHIVMLGKEYMVPRGDGHILVGSTEEPEAGYEKANTEAAVAYLQELAVRTVPALGKARREKCWSGLRPGSPDGLPFLGPVPGFTNAFVATGHFRAGVQLSIGTALVLSELITARPTSVPLEDFRLDREPGRGLRPTFRS